jgi:hypothetical protein
MAIGPGKDVAIQNIRAEVKQDLQNLENLENLENFHKANHAKETQ